MMKILTFPDKLLEPGSIFFPACVTYSEENSHRSLTLRRDGRVAEGARLESVFTRKGNVGSNPTLSASKSKLQRNCPAFCREIRKTCPRRFDGTLSSKARPAELGDFQRFLQ